MQPRRISIDDPRAPDVRALLERHLAFAHETTPAEDVHALDVDALLDPAVTFFSLRQDGELLGVAALKEVEPHHGELKSMHTARVARGRGVGRALVEHLVDVARRRGYERLSLETGAGPAFAPAHTLYKGAGFTRCEPFGDYEPSRNSCFLTRALARPPA